MIGNHKKTNIFLCFSLYKQLLCTEKKNNPCIPIQLYFFISRSTYSGIHLLLGFYFEITTVNCVAENNFRNSKYELKIYKWK